MNHNILPDSIELEDWLNPQYVENFRQGLLYNWCHDIPFKHAVLPNLFLSSIINSITQYCRSIPVERSHIEGISSQTDWHWGAFNCHEVVRFIYSKHFQAFLNALLRERVKVKSDLVPQYNIFQSGSHGIPIHTDYGRSIDIVSLLQLSQNYQFGYGGDLIFYKEVNEKLVAFKFIPPQCNTFVVFKVSQASYHSVAKMHHHWIRENIAFDWYINS